MKLQLKKPASRSIIRIVLSFTLLLIYNLTNAQVIDCPRYAARSKDNVLITQIEFVKDRTIITLKLNFKGSCNNFPIVTSEIVPIMNKNNAIPTPTFFTIPKESYIVQSSTNKKFPLIEAIGFSIDEKIKTEQDNPIIIKLAFGNISSEISNIDLRCGEINFFDIQIYSNVPKIKKSTTERGIIKKDGKEWSYIKNPGYVAKSSSSFNITMVELTDTATILHFETSVSSSFLVPAESCIIPSNGGEPLFVKYAEGVTINQSNVNNGEIRTYKLFFPVLEKSINRINFKELNGGNWSVYELEVR
jgi:hypothetical protein